MDAVRVDRRDENLALGGYRGAETAGKLARPAQLRVGRHVGRGAPAPAGIVAIRRPTFRLRIAGCGLRSCAKGRAFLQPFRLRGRLVRRTLGGGGGQCDQAVELCSYIAVAGVWRGVKQAFTWGAEDIGWLKAAPSYYFLGDESAMPPQGSMNTGQKASGKE